MLARILMSSEHYMPLIHGLLTSSRPLSAFRSEAENMCCTRSSNGCSVAVMLLQWTFLRKQDAVSAYARAWCAGWLRQREQRQGATAVRICVNGAEGTNLVPTSGMELGLHPEIKTYARVFGLHITQNIHDNNK